MQHHLEDIDRVQKFSWSKAEWQGTCKNCGEMCCWMSQDAEDWDPIPGGDKLGWCYAGKHIPFDDPPPEHWAEDKRAERTKQCHEEFMRRFRQTDYHGDDYESSECDDSEDEEY
eukprot:scaffold445845_cov35-Prasinocladus_malaysianus.AAC.1